MQKTIKKTITIRLTEEEHNLLTRTCKLLQTSQSAYLTRQAKEQAKRDLLEFAVQRYLSGQASYSELATQTGLSVPILMDAIAQASATDTQCVKALIEAAKSLAEAHADPAFYELARDALAK